MAQRTVENELAAAELIAHLQQPDPNLANPHPLPALLRPKRFRFLSHDPRPYPTSRAPRSECDVSN